MMGKRFLFVTANANETTAFLNEGGFFSYTPNQTSDNPNDDTYYNVGTIGKHEAIHFELQDQGSVKDGASLLAVTNAIKAWVPDAVILVGIAFGKDNEEKLEPRQHIGDILISEMIQDYESGKIKNGDLHSDGACPESGKTLTAVFKHFSKQWEYIIGSRQAECVFGTMLSGDKVVDDKEFKQDLFEKYSRAIGGEMEGRGAYYACRSERLQEWIVIKAICDWGESKDNTNKQNDQVTASRSVVSLLKHVFLQESAFEKLPERKEKAGVKKKPLLTMPMGHFINIGSTSCRLLEVVDQETLKEICVMSYDISDPLEYDYLQGIIDQVKNEILPLMYKGQSKILKKVFVDCTFEDIFKRRFDKFKEAQELRDFIRNFYKETNLYFNILSETQTRDNLQRVLGSSLLDKSAIINIGSHNTEIVVFVNNRFSMYSLDVTLADVKFFVENSIIPEEWDIKTKTKIQNFIRDKIGDSLKAVKVEQAFILKDELKFMQDAKYPLRMYNGHSSLTQKQYEFKNMEYLFSADYKSLLSEKQCDEATIRRLYGFKYGHILIETILGIMENKRVIPKNDLSIHGSGINAYIFNIVISGSTHDNGTAVMFQAGNVMKKLGVVVTSPNFNDDGSLASEITSETEYAHLQSIHDCDVLLVCGKGDDGYIGESTKCEMYYAYALRKTIAFWQKPPDDNRLSFIPIEQWETIQSIVL